MIESDDYEEVEVRPYQCLIAKLIYLACSIRLDITFAIKQLSKYKFDLRKRHL